MTNNDNKNIYFIIFIISIISIICINKIYNKEHFIFAPWNMGTRFQPSYDLRGYPLIYPWNYPFPGTPLLYFSPYYYNTDGSYSYDPNFSKISNKYIKDITSNN
jgi:hypothetical protein